MLESNIVGLERGVLVVYYVYDSFCLGFVVEIGFIGVDGWVFILKGGFEDIGVGFDIVMWLWSVFVC